MHNKFDATPEAPAQHLLLRGASVLDGSGAAARRADVLVGPDGRIAAVAATGAMEAPTAATTIDLAGLTLAPGFIDLHTHSDAALLHDGRGHSQLLKGVTLEVIDNWGFSCAPCAANARHAMTLGSELPAAPSPRRTNA